MIIKDNRIVSDRTFAIRFRNFLKDIKVNDPASEEELEYLKCVAKELVIHQFDTVVDESEKDYLLRCLGVPMGKGPKNNPFYKFKI